MVCRPAASKPIMSTPDPVDSATVTATLTLSNPAAGSLSIATSGAVTSTYDAVTGVWTASGAITNVNTLLAGVIFNPAQDFNSNFTIATSVIDDMSATITGNKTQNAVRIVHAPSGVLVVASERRSLERGTFDLAVNLGLA